MHPPYVGHFSFEASVFENISWYDIQIEWRCVTKNMCLEYELCVSLLEYDYKLIDFLYKNGWDDVCLNEKNMMIIGVDFQDSYKSGGQRRLQLHPRPRRSCKVAT